MLIVILTLLFMRDLTRPPEYQLTVKGVVFSIEQYHKYLSPHLSGIVTCKFTPHCSAYAIMALQKYGALKGTLMTVNRLAKCSPLSSVHGADYP